MSENTMPEQEEVALNATPPTDAEIEGAREASSQQAAAEITAEEADLDVAAGTPSGLQGVSQEQMALLREKLKRFGAKSGAKTISGSEAVEDAKPEEGTGSVTTGKDVDWSEYDLDYSVKHLYPQASFRMTPQGPKWIAMLDEFLSTERDFRNYGKQVKTPNGEGTESVNLGEWLNDMLNSPGGWRVVSILPSGMGRAGVLLQRQSPIALPNPKPLKKATEVAIPREEELQRVQDAAQAFMETEGLAPGETPLEQIATEGADHTALEG
jgi:hypothetical protein